MLIFFYSILTLFFYILLYNPLCVFLLLHFIISHPHIILFYICSVILLLFSLFCLILFLFSSDFTLFFSIFFYSSVLSSCYSILIYSPSVQSSFYFILRVEAQLSWDAVMNHSRRKTDTSLSNYMCLHVFLEHSFQSENQFYAVGVPI